MMSCSLIDIDWLNSCRGAMDEFSPLPDAVSHKQLDSFLSAALKKAGSSELAHVELSPEKEQFRTLLSEWLENSRKVVDILESKDPHILSGYQPKQIMALGALRAHLVNAMRAHHASEKI